MIEPVGLRSIHCTTYYKTAPSSWYMTPQNSQSLPGHNQGQLGAHLADSMDAASEGDVLTDIL